MSDVHAMTRADTHVNCPVSCQLQINTVSQGRNLLSNGTVFLRIPCQQKTLSKHSILTNDADLFFFNLNNRTGTWSKVVTVAYDTCNTGSDLSCVVTAITHPWRRIYVDPHQEYIFLAWSRCRNTNNNTLPVPIIEKLSYIVRKPVSISVRGIGLPTAYLLQNEDIWYMWVPLTIL